MNTRFGSKDGSLASLSVSSSNSGHREEKPKRTSVIGSVATTLLGPPLPTLQSGYYPTNREILQHYFYLTTNEKCSKNVAFASVCRLLRSIWERSEIPQCSRSSTDRRLQHLLDEYTKVQKHNALQESASTKQLQQNFDESLDWVFFNGSEDSKPAFGDMMNRKLPARKRLLHATNTSEISSASSSGSSSASSSASSSDPNIVNPLSDVPPAVTDENLVPMFDGEQPRPSKTSKRQIEDDNVSESDSETSDGDDTDYDDSEGDEPAMISKDEVIKILLSDRDLLSNADREQRSDQDLAREAALLAKALGVSITSVRGSSFSSIRRRRKMIRAEVAAQCTKEFKSSVASNPEKILCVHWDGKLMPNTTEGNQTCVDRLPIMLTGLPTPYLLEIPKLLDGKGVTQAKEICRTIREIGVQDKISFLCCDTTASNTGKKRGAVTLIEKELGKMLLEIDCLHHRFELVAKGVKQKLYGKSTAPTDTSNDSFVKIYHLVRNDPIEPLSADDLKSVPVQYLEKVVHDLEQGLLSVKLRGDYRELIKLSLVLLGKEELVQKNDEQYRLQNCGSTSAARFMGDFLIKMKRYLLRATAVETDENNDKNRRLCMFGALVYTRSWIQCMNLFDAPLTCLQLYKDIVSWENVDSEVSMSARHKMANYLEYVSPELVWLSFFSNRVPVKEKRAMQQKLIGECPDLWDASHRAKETIITTTRKVKGVSFVEFSIKLEEMELIDLMTPLVRKISLHFGFDLLSTNFEDANYSKMRCRLEHIPSVNDEAERGVKLAKDLNAFGPRTEAEKQNLYKTVHQARKKFKAVSKAGMATEMNTK